MIMMMTMIDGLMIMLMMMNGWMNGNDDTDDGWMDE